MLPAILLKQEGLWWHRESELTYDWDNRGRPADIPDRLEEDSVLRGREVEYDGVAPAGQVPNAFQPIGLALTFTCVSRIARVLQAWNQPFARSSYGLIRFPLLELACLGKIPKAAKKKMNPLGDVEDDYELIESVIAQSNEVETFSVDPETLELTKMVGPVELSVPLEVYEIADEEEEMVLADRLKAKKKGKAIGPADSGVTFSGKRVGEHVDATEVIRAKKTKVGGSVTVGAGFGALAPVAPKTKLNRVLHEAGMADERFVRRMVEDLKDAGTDLFIAKNATPPPPPPRENRAKMLAQGMRFMHSLYLVDEVEKDPITREQLVKVEKAFDKAEGERLKAEAALGKAREEKGVLQTKLKEGEAWAVVLKEEIERLMRSPAERAVEEFKKSPEMAQLLREQHRKSVAENTSLYKTRGWLNVEKLLADRKADREKKAGEEMAAAEKSGQGEVVPAETEAESGAEADQAKL
ncbi:hypothetical protein M0R45_030481 [Rubus argutus]|uniref:Uncharacterized protein n=1 Tax=Rubus argutus TaxID=59490 RepID=A0AAW1WDD6_RUBAR